MIRLCRPQLVGLLQPLKYNVRPVIATQVHGLTFPPNQTQHNTKSFSTSVSNEPEHKGTEHKHLNKQNIKEKTGKVRMFLRKYGPVGVVTYFGMYGVTLGTMYILVSKGLIVSTDVISLLQKIGCALWKLVLCLFVGVVHVFWCVLET